MLDKTAMLDQTAGWKSYARLHAAQTDPRRRAMVANMLDHYKWEVLGRPENLIGGLHPESHYRFYGLRCGFVEYRGLPEIEAFYRNLVDLGANILSLDTHYLLVDDEVVSGQGVWHQVYRGADLMNEGGLIYSPDAGDPEGHYLVSQSMGWFMPYSHDEVPLLMGEIVYFSPQPLSLRKLDEGEDVFNQVTEADFVL